MGRPVALTDKVMIGLKFLLLDRDSSQDSQIGFPQLRDSLQLANEGFRG
ncbi:hypothetical protein ACVWWD_006028 [Mesorhizobium sp. URHB0026]|nr:hypothetical protein X741_29140 [Mesorhizobium sp. LNHC229A00]